MSPRCARPAWALPLLSALLLPPVAFAAGADRPSEDSMFGEPAKPPQPASPAAEQSQPAPAPQEGAAPGGEEKGDAAELSGPPATNAFETGESKDDPLKIGGQFYMRGYAQTSHGVSLSNSYLALPTLVDVYLDSRPTDRLRAMVLGRLTYDPLQSATSSVGPSTTAASNPSVALDQAWLAFDIEHRVFLTAGRQHVKWGTSRFWNPNDFLSAVRRDPLAVFDARLGVTMLKVHVPWESKGWNFYGIALFGNTQQPGGVGTGGSSGSATPVQEGLGQSDNPPALNLLGDIGGAARGEVTLGNATFGLDMLAQRNRKPRFGADLTAPLGPLDVYAEAAIKRGVDTPLYRFAAVPNPSLGVVGNYETYSPNDLNVGVSGGFTYDIPYSDNDSLVLGAEYFYNSLGYSDAHLYPPLLVTGNYQPFYTGQHYGAFYVVLVGPGSWDKTSFTLSNLANLSDLSVVSRIDFSVRILSYLTVEAFWGVHYGNTGGEFKLGLDIPALDYNGQHVNATHIPAPLFDLGMGLRMSI